MENLTIHQILENVKIVGQRIFDANGFEFQRGFNICFAFFEEQLKKTHLIHQSLLVEEIKELEKKNKGLGDLAKVSFVGSQLLEQHQINEFQSKISEKEKTIRQLEGEIQRLKSKLDSQEKEKKSFFETIRVTKPKNQTDDKASKKQRKALQFIQYISLDEQFEEYLKNGHLEVI